MIRHLYFLIILVFWTSFSFAQQDTSAISQSEWKKIVEINKFKATKNKFKIPLTVLKQIHIDNVSEITRYRFRWQGSCAWRITIYSSFPFF